MTREEIIREFKQRAHNHRVRLIFGRLLKRYYNVVTTNADLIPPEMKHKNGITSKTRVLLHFIETGEIVEGCDITPKEDSDGVPNQQGRTESG
jgi:hypothetical protein